MWKLFSRIMFFQITIGKQKSPFTAKFKAVLSMSLIAPDLACLKQQTLYLTVSIDQKPGCNLAQCLQVKVPVGAKQGVGLAIVLSDLDCEELYFKTHLGLSLSGLTSGHGNWLPPGSGKHKRKKVNLLMI